MAATATALFVGTTSCSLKAVRLRAGVSALGAHSSSFCNTRTPQPPPRQRTRVTPVTCKLIRPERYASNDWLRSLSSLPQSQILKRVLPRLVPNLIVCTITTVAYVTYSELYPNAQFGVSSLPHSFLATLLSLVLVFRSNAAYDKFDEGRRLWGRLINISRGFGRLASAALPAHHAKVVASLACLYPYALMHHLYDRRELDPFERILLPLRIPSELRPTRHQLEHPRDPRDARERELDVDGATVAVLDTMPARLIEPSEMADRINAAPNKPLEVVVHLGIAVRAAMNYKEARESRINGGIPTMSVSVERQMMEDLMNQLLDIQGGCERIVKTPIPLSWSRHTSRLLSIWSLTLPAVLVPLEGWFCIPTVAIISWAIFSIEEIAHIMEDPFLEQRYCLPLRSFCKTIETDVLGQLL